MRTLSRQPLGGVRSVPTLMTGNADLLHQTGACTQRSEQLARGSLVLTMHSSFLEDSGKFSNQSLRVLRGLIWYTRPDLLKTRNEKEMGELQKGSGYPWETDSGASDSPIKSDFRHFWVLFNSRKTGNAN